jgi:uncharacterized protein YecE (DUF72 family)
MRKKAVPLEGLEPPTVSLGRNCSSIELQRLAERVYPDRVSVPGVRLPTMTEKIGRAYVGTSGWKKPQWRGDFYPNGLVQRRELEFASRQFTSLEINSTFHGLQRPSTFTSWRIEAPDDFVFAVKGYEVVTRTALFPTARVHLADFFASGVLELREKLGPLLWQLPEQSKFRAESFERFLSLLPRSTDDAVKLAAQSEASEAAVSEQPDRRIRHAIEVRDASYLNTEFIDLLKAHNIGLVLTNAPGAPDLRDLTSDFVYLRLSSGEDHYADGYDDVALDNWAARIGGWVVGPPARDVFAYFKNPAGVLPHTPHNATRLIARL